MTPTAPGDSDRPVRTPRDAGAPGWHVVVPVKPLDRAKSRLTGLGDDVRRDLALAFLLDVLDAVRGAPDVLGIAVVTSDDGVAGRVRADLGARVQVVPDAEPMELNHALHRGAAALASANGAGPRAGAGAAPDAAVLALCADLPALTTVAVAELLAAAPRSGAGFVADHTGAGTTAYLAGPAHFDPRFGVGSRAAHAEQGATDLTAFARPGLRADVDTPEDLWAMLDGSDVGRPTLELGPATRDVVRRHGLGRSPRDRR
jgi:2-phospho-L-lactate guanylyltransferase